jgi:hypothetical protein
LNTRGIYGNRWISKNIEVVLGLEASSGILRISRLERYLDFGIIGWIAIVED